MKNTSIITQQQFSTDVKTVWQAITQHDKMIRWFFRDIPDFKPEVGFKTQFNVNTGERNFIHLWEITAVIPEQKIVYDWRYESYEGQGTVIFYLEHQEEQTLLTVTAMGMDSFPQNIPEFSRESCQGGWNYFIKEQLKNYLN